MARLKIEFSDWLMAALATIFIFEDQYLGALVLVLFYLLLRFFR
jgi:hypothetical protein